MTTTKGKGKAKGTGKAKGAGAAKGKAPTLEVAVSFGGLSIGDATARLGCKINREFLNVVDADELFTGKRLSVVVQLGSGLPDQQELFDFKIEVAGSVDVKRIGVSVDTITAGLTFALASIDVATLAKFSKGIGRLKIFDVELIPDDAQAVDEHAEPDAE